MNTAELMKRAADFRLQLRHEEAIECYRAVTTAQPSHADAWFLLAFILEYLNRLDESESVIASARVHHPGFHYFDLVEAKIARRRKDNARALSLMEKSLSVIDAERPSHFPFYFEAGQLYDTVGQPQKAWECLRMANRLQGAGADARTIDRTGFFRRVQRYTETFSDSWIKTWTSATLPPNDTGHRPPVFMVGFPRSGTTLLDMALSGHPDIAVAEEKPVIAALVADLEKRPGAFPANLATLSAADIAQARRKFFDLHKIYGTDISKSVLIDRAPLNIIYAGVIHRLFPDAKFILALRDPRDAVLSCFMQAFALNEATIHFLDPRTAAELYDKSFGLWFHLTALLPFKVHELKYEDLTADPESTARALLDYLDLAWDARVLRPEETAAARPAINTASHSQVREPIHRRASGRWRRYADLPGTPLAAMLDILDPWAREFGYETEMEQEIATN